MPDPVRPVVLFKPRTSQAKLRAAVLTIQAVLRGERVRKVHADIVEAIRESSRSGSSPCPPPRRNVGEGGAARRRRGGCEAVARAVVRAAARAE